MSLRYMQYRTSLAHNVVAEKDNNQHDSKMNKNDLAITATVTPEPTKNDKADATIPPTPATTNSSTSRMQKYRSALLRRAAVVGGDNNNENDAANGGGFFERTNLDRTLSSASGATLSSIDTAGKSWSTMGGDSITGTYHNLVGNEIVMPEIQESSSTAIETGQALPPAEPLVLSIADPPPSAPSLDIPEPASENTSPTTTTKATAAAPRYQTYRATLSKKVLPQALSQQNQSPDNNSAADLPTLSASDIAKTVATAMSLQSPRYEAYRAVLAKSVVGGGGSSTITPTLTDAENNALDTTTTSTTTAPKETKKVNYSGENPQSPRYIAYRSSLAKSVTTPTKPAANVENSSLNAAMATVPQRSNEKDAEEEKKLDANDDSFSLREDIDNNVMKPMDDSNSDMANEEGVPDEKQNKAAVGQDEEDKNLATRLSTFLSKAEKGKPPPPVDETDDMHTSWSDFDAADLPDTASRASVGTRKSRIEGLTVTEEQERLIEHVLASTAKMRSSQKSQEAPRGEIQNERAKSHDEEQAQEIVEQRKDDDAAVPDIENGLATSGKTQGQEQMVEPTRRRMSKKQRTAFLVACIIVAMVLLILGYVFR